MDFPGIKKEYMEQIGKLESWIAQIKQNIEKTTEESMLDSKVIDQMIKDMQEGLDGLKTANKKGELFNTLCAIQLKIHELALLLASIEKEKEFKITSSDLAGLITEIEEYTLEI